MRIRLTNSVTLDDEAMRLEIVVNGKVKYCYVNQQETNLLKELSEKPAGQIVESTELVARALQSVKQAQDGGIPNLNVVVSKLRRKVRSAAGGQLPLIKTYWGRGYSIVQEDRANEVADEASKVQAAEGQANRDEQSKERSDA
jgi:DNA-binding winged helix-turn-helix (wHTH) protein